MDLVGAFIWRVAGPLSPSLRARLLWLRGGAEVANKAVVGAVATPGSVALDLGANIGVYTERFARAVGPAGAVYAFEPHPDCARTLTRISRRHGNVRFIAAAASDQVGHAALSVPSSDDETLPALATLEPRDRTAAHETVEVATTTVDASLGAVRGVSVLKCDVEGHEHEALMGARELLEREQPVILIEVEQRHRSRPVAETFELLSDQGYAGHMLTPDGPRPLEEFDLARDQLDLIADDPQVPIPPPGYVNDFLFVPRSRELPELDRLLAAPR